MKELIKRIYFPNSVSSCLTVLEASTMDTSFLQNYRIEIFCSKCGIVLLFDDISVHMMHIHPEQIATWRNIIVTRKTCLRCDFRTTNSDE